MDHTADLMTRRQALARVAYMLGGAVSAPTVAGVLAGCAPRLAAGGAAWRPRTLSREQSEMVLTFGEYILPQTDTPGARAARVDRFIDAMLTDYLDEPARRHFVAGLERAEARARRAFGKRFLKLPPGRQLELVQALNRAAYRERKVSTTVPPTEQSEEPTVPENRVATGHERPVPVVDANWDPHDMGQGSFFRTLKELVLVGYYTSEVGATEELSPNPMGVWRADVPYSEIGHSWA